MHHGTNHGSMVYALGITTMPKLCTSLIQKKKKSKDTFWFSPKRSNIIFCNVLIMTEIFIFDACERLPQAVLRIKPNQSPGKVGKRNTEYEFLLDFYTKTLYK